MQPSTAPDTQPVGIISMESKRMPPRRHQLHFWIGDREYQFLRYMTDVEEETLSSLLRRIIRNLMRQSNKLAFTAPEERNVGTSARN